MASSSSFIASIGAGKTMQTREVTPLGEASSSEGTETLYDEGEPIEDTSSLPLNLVVNLLLLWPFLRLLQTQKRG